MLARVAMGAWTAKLEINSQSQRSQRDSPSIAVGNRLPATCTQRARVGSAAACVERRTFQAPARPEWSLPPIVIAKRPQVVSTTTPSCHRTREARAPMLVLVPTWAASATEVRPRPPSTATQTYRMRPQRKGHGPKRRRLQGKQADGRRPLSLRFLLQAGVWRHPPRRPGTVASKPRARVLFNGELCPGVAGAVWSTAASTQRHLRSSHVCLKW